MLNRDEILIYLKQNLSQHRFHHILMVEKRAKELALFYGADVYSCTMAALFHDILKEIEPNKMLQYIDEDSIIYLENFKKCLGIWHGFAASEFIKIHFGVKSKDIINAVRYHSTARVDMSDIEKIIFVSDFTSCDRNFILNMNENDFLSLDRYFFYVLKSNISFLINTNRLIYLSTLDAYNFYLKKEKFENGSCEKKKE